MLKRNALNILVLIVLWPLVTPSVAAEENIASVRDIRNTEVNEQKLLQAVASRTLTWLTGSSSNNDYISVGRTANFFGFVGLRVASGQSLARRDVANDTLATLNTSQRNSLIALLADQLDPFQKTHQARFRMNRTLEGLLVGDTISRDEFLELGREYGASEATLGRVIAQRLGDVAQSLTADQMTALEQIRAAHISGQSDSIERGSLRLKLPQEDKKELVNIAARFLSWTTGSQLYNDFEVVGKPSQHFGFVSLRIDSNHGIRRGDIAREVRDLLNSDQQRLLSAAAVDNAERFNTFLDARAALMRHLEVAQSGETIDSEKVRKLGAAVGEIEAAMTWSQAMAMIGVRNTLSESQSSELLAMRQRYTPALSNEIEDPMVHGRQLFAQCVLCHDSGNRQAVAPSLAGIVGRNIAADSTFQGYSSALRNYAEVEGVWSETLLDRFLTSPRSLVPGTYMRFDGLEQSEHRAALIMYLKTRE